MAETIQVHNFKLSFIWVETLPALLGAGAPPLPMSFLRSFSGYSQVFDGLLKGEPGPFDVHLPWVTLKKQRFWFSYLQRNEGEPLTGSAAWRSLVPFRWKLPFTFRTTADPPVEVFTEGFLYPHGIALVLTLQSKSSRSLYDAVDHALALRHDALYTLEENGGETPGQTLDDVAKRGMHLLREAVLGPNGGVAIPFDQEDPFSLATILNAAGVDPTQALDATKAIEDNAPVHRALHGLTSWAHNWKTGQLPSLKDETLKRPTDSSASLGCVLYTRRRGQAIWSPDRFEDNGNFKTSLSCLHRNLVFASMHVESLCGLATHTASMIRKGGVDSLPAVHKQCAKLAAGILGTMYGGKRHLTYRSSSIPLHITQNGREDDVNLLRKELMEDAPSLHASP